MRPELQRQNTDQILSYYYGPPPDLNRRFRSEDKGADGAGNEKDDEHDEKDGVDNPHDGADKPHDMATARPERPPRAAPPPRPPRLSSPPPKASPSTSFRSLASTVSVPERPIAVVRGNSEYTIAAVSDPSSERTTPIEETTSSHRREGAFPAHSVLLSNSHSGDGLPQPSADDRSFYDPGRVLAAVDESEDDANDEGTRRTRSGTITSRTHTTPSNPSHHTQSSVSHYTSSSVSLYDASDDMQDLIATVGSALDDLGFDPADVPPPNVLPLLDDDKPSRRGSVDNLRASIEAKRSIRSPTSSLTGSPRTSMSANPADHAMRGSPKINPSELARASPRPSIADFSRGSPRTSIRDLARGSPKPSMSDPARSSPKPSVADFPRSEYSRNSPRPMSLVEPRSPLSRPASPEKRRRDLSPEKPRLSDAVRAREASPEKGQPRDRARRRDTSPDKPRTEEVSRDVGARSVSPPVVNATGSPRNGVSPAARFSPDSKSNRSRSPEKARHPSSLPPIARGSYEKASTELSSPRSTHTHTGSVAQTTRTSSTHPSPQTPTSPHGASLARSATLPRRNTGSTDHFKFRQPGAPLPECFYFSDVLKMKTSAERAQGYIKKINQLAAEDSGLSYWVGFMKGRVRTGPDGQHTPASNPTSPTTFGPHGPGTRRQPQPRHVSGGSMTSEVTFAVRPDAYVATNISIRAESPPLGPPPSLPYPSLAKDIGIRSIDSRSVTSSGTGTSSSSGAIKAKVGTVGFFSSIGRKTSVRRERDRTVMQQARKPHALRTGTIANGVTTSPGGYAELPNPVKPVQLSAPPTIPGGPRVRSDKTGGRREQPLRSGSLLGHGDSASEVGHGGARLSPRGSVVMIGGRDSFQTMSPSGDGRPISIRVPSSNGHGVVSPNLPPISPVLSSAGIRSLEPPSSYRTADVGSVYSGYSGYSTRDSAYRGGGSRASSAHGHGNGSGNGSGNGGGGGSLEQLVDVLPHVDRSVLAGYLDRAGGNEIDAISAYLEDERRMNPQRAGVGQ